MNTYDPNRRVRSAFVVAPELIEYQKPAMPTRLQQYESMPVVAAVNDDDYRRGIFNAFLEQRVQ